MPRGRWTETVESLATEAFAILIRRQRSTRTYPKAKLKEILKEREIYTHFIKLCIEYNETPDLTFVRRGLALIVQNQNATELARKAGFSRVSLYRMLSKNGNPRLNNMVALLNSLGLRFWIVDRAFVYRERSFVRPKEVQPDKENIHKAPAIHPKSIRGYS